MKEGLTMKTEINVIYTDAWR